jgi:hypothetical protein
MQQEKKKIKSKSMILVGDRYYELTKDDTIKKWFFHKRKQALIDKDGNPMKDEQGNPMFKEITEYLVDWVVSLEEFKKGNFPRDGRTHKNLNLILEELGVDI